MEANSLQGYIDNTMRILAEIRGSLRSLQNGSITAVPVAALATQLDGVYQGARRFALVSIEDAVKDTMGVLFAIASKEKTPAEAIEAISRLETLLLKKSLEDDYLALDAGDKPQSEDPVANELFEEFEFAVNRDQEPHPTESSRPFVADETEIEAFEVDEELLEIFSGEAEELLQNIERSLEALTADPNDKSSLWEIRRNAHTFKGSAGIVGLKQLSELAHRVEDLLDRLAETTSPTTPGLLNLLRSSFDCLKALTAGDGSAALFHRISQLYWDFDGVLAGLEISESSSPVEVPPTFAATSAHTPEPVIAKAVEPEFVTETAAEAEPADEAPFIEPPPIPMPTVDDAVFAPVVVERPSKAPQTRSAVRVSLERLDELVGVVRDMIIGRSAMERRLKDLERQIDELHNTARRLQITSTKLEVDYEASMLSSDRSPVIEPSNHHEGAHRALPGGFDELEFDNYTEFHQSTREIAEVTNDTFAINTVLDSLRSDLEGMCVHQRDLVEDMHDKLMRIRRVPFGSLATRLQRAVRFTCEEEKKKAEVVVENESVDVDTQILDALAEPLMHLLKNAVVHGIETPAARVEAGKPEVGTIRVKVANEDTHIAVTVTDDGRGVTPKAVVEKAIALGLVTRENTHSLTDQEALDMIFLPGLSTAERLNISAGRGVGMSIVKESIQAHKGTIRVNSEPGVGVSFDIRMPLPLAVAGVLVVESGKQTLAMLRKNAKQIVEIEGDVLPETVEVSGVSYPLVSMRGQGAGSKAPTGGTRHAIIMKQQGDEFALLVDEVKGNEDVVIKPVGHPLDKIKGMIGTTTLGSGELVPIMDVSAVLAAEGVEDSPIDELVDEVPLTVMIVDDSPSVRHLTSKVVAGAGWTVMTAKDGADALEQLLSGEQLPAVILSDIEMPRMDGYELAASIRRSDELNHIPVIIITSRAAEKHREKAFETGVSHYLTKPYDDKELLSAIRKLADSIY